MKKLILTFLFLAFLAPVLFAQDREGDLAVMETSFSGQGLNRTQIDSLSDLIRAKAVDLTKYRVMTKENNLAILRDKKVDMARCADAECVIEFGRILKADKLVTSNLFLSEGVYYLTLKFYDVASASIDKVLDQECKACNFSKLRQIVKNTAQELLGSGMPVPAEKKEEASVVASQGALLVETKPPGANVFFDGVQKGQTAEGQILIISRLMPGSHKVRVEHPDYEIEEQNVEVAPGVQGKVEVTLQLKPGALTVAATPVEASVWINGKEMGETPYMVRLQSGEYLVKVVAKNFKPQEKKILVQANRSLTLPFSLEKEPKIGEEFMPEGTKGGPMVIIPDGEFMMGCNKAVDNQCSDDEKPYHQVYLDAFYIDKYEVTVTEYDKCVNEGKCKAPRSKSDNQYCNLGYSDRGDHPVNCVNWDQTNSYCAWAGKRLPTEAEWEKAARGTDGRKYPWGNKKAYCDYVVMSQRGRGCDRNSTWPVGSKPKGASAHGVMDMAGNVWEWVQDWYDGNYYGVSPARNPSGPSYGNDRTLRGGSWYGSFLGDFRASYRYRGNPTSREYNVGFRCARDAK
jgi:formylglycine-generating enzyme required for sulfatase activity